MNIKEEIIENLDGKEKFIVLSYDRGVFDLYKIYAKDEGKAYQIIEDEIASNSSTEILLTLDEFNSLKKMIRKFKI